MCFFLSHDKIKAFYKRKSFFTSTTYLYSRGNFAPADEFYFAGMGPEPVCCWRIKLWRKGFQLQTLTVLQRSNGWIIYWAWNHLPPSPYNDLIWSRCVEVQPSTSCSTSAEFPLTMFFTIWNFENKLALLKSANFETFFAKKFASVMRWFLL